MAGEGASVRDPESQAQSRKFSDASRAPEPWWRIHPFRGMVNDVRRRLPYYPSDWRDAWDYRVVPATVYMYFAKLVVSCRASIVSSALPSELHS